MATYANAVYGFSLFVLSTEVSFSVFLNSYLEKNSQPLMRQVNQNLRETSMKDYNQLKVSFFGEGEAQISLQSLIHEIGGALIYCTDLNLFLFLFDLSDFRRVGRTPWFIAYDATYNAVVISIRGTWSLTDVVTDILAGPRGFLLSFADVQPLDEAGKEYGFDGTGEYTHRVLRPIHSIKARECTS